MAVARHVLHTVMVVQVEITRKGRAVLALAAAGRACGDGDCKAQSLGGEHVGGGFAHLGLTVRLDLE